MHFRCHIQLQQTFKHTSPKLCLWHSHLQCEIRILKALNVAICFHDMVFSTVRLASTKSAWSNDEGRFGSPATNFPSKVDAHTGIVESLKQLLCATTHLESLVLVLRSLMGQYCSSSLYEHYLQTGHARSMENIGILWYHTLELWPLCLVFAILHKIVITIIYLDQEQYFQFLTWTILYCSSLKHCYNLDTVPCHTVPHVPFC